MKITEKFNSKSGYAIFVSGADRFSTNLAVISRFKDVLDMSSVYLASALNFPDSLSGSALSQKNKAPLILISEDINEDEQNGIKQILTSAQNINVLGLEGAVSLESLYLVGLEKKTPEPKNSQPQPPTWTDTFNVMNAGETTRVYIKKSPSSSSENIASTYRSLAEVKILDTSGEYFYVEILDYDTLNYVRGCVLKSNVKTVTPSEPYNILVDKKTKSRYI